MRDRLWTGKPFRYVTSQLGQLSLSSLRGRQIEYQPARLGWRRGGHLCRVADNTVWSHWQVASRSSEVNFTKNYTLLYLYLLKGVLQLLSAVRVVPSLVRIVPAVWPTIKNEHTNMRNNIIRWICDNRSVGRREEAVWIPFRHCWLQQRSATTTWPDPVDRRWRGTWP